MKKILFLIIITIIATDAFAQYYGGYSYSSSHYKMDTAQAKFYAYRRNYSELDYPIAFAIHHSIAQADGCNGEWGFWFEVAGIELGMGIDGDTYSEELVSKEEYPWLGGTTSKIYYSYKGVKAASFITYLGAYIRNWISVGAVMDYDYGPYTRLKTQYNYSYGIDSDFKDSGPVTDGSAISWGLYVKGNFQFKKHYNIFLLGRACLNGNNGLVLGFGVNI